MKKYNVEVYNSGFESDTINIHDEKLIDILIHFAVSIDPQGLNDGDYDKAINDIKELYEKTN